MSNHSGILRLVISAFICVLITMYTALSIFTQNTLPSVISTSHGAQSAALFVPANGNIGFTDSEASSGNEGGEQNTSSNKTEEISQVSASDGKVLGKIIEKFITPYTANTSYNNVYLKNSTELTVNIKELLAAPLSFKIEKNSEPQVLIMHTHTTESFMLEEREYYTDTDSARRNDSNCNNVRLGNIVCEKLNAAGIAALHDTTVHDYPEYNGSYNRAAKTIKSYLAKYPSIKIVLDLHRDAITSGESDKVKPVTEINGKKAAQIMLVLGSQSGSVTDFPNWKENLKLGVRLQQTLEVKYPTLARSLYFCARRYNENLTNGSMIIEIGTDANTIDEVSYSAELLGESLCELLNRLG